MVGGGSGWCLGQGSTGMEWALRPEADQHHHRPLSRMPLRQLPRDSELVESGGIQLFQNDPVSTAANAHTLLLQMPLFRY